MEGTFSVGIKVVIFDLDGTLFDTRRDIVAAVNRARQFFSLPPLDPEQVISMVGYGMEKLAAAAFQQTGVPVQEAYGRILEDYRAHPADLAFPYPGVVELLPRLKPSRAIVSNKPRFLVEILLERYRLGSCFDPILGGDSLPRIKPDPLAVQIVRKRYDVALQELLMVGDHVPDIEMARRAGIRSVYCRYGFFGGSPEGADFYIESFEELANLLERI